MKKIYTNRVFSPAGNALLHELEDAGISCELKVDAADGKYPWHTFSEMCLINDADYERALNLIEDMPERIPGQFTHTHNRNQN